MKKQKIMIDIKNKNFISDFLKKSDKDSFKFPKISVIMPSYNQEDYIEKSILSVIRQNYPNLELIIIDGKSTDNTVKIIKKYEEYIDYWETKEDRGQSHAINKGIKKSTGDLITWLNSDDIYLPNALINIGFHWLKNESPDWIVGNTIKIDKNNSIVHISKGEQYNKYLVSNGILNVSGPSSFFTKKMIKESGYLDEDFIYQMDTELWWRFINNGYKFSRVKNYIWGFRLHENAKTSMHNFANEETKRVSKYKKRMKKESKMIKDLYNIDKIHFYPAVILKLFDINYIKGKFDNFYFKLINFLN